MQGSWLIVSLGLGLTTAACLTLGALLYALLRDAARALSMAGALTAPGFAFMGVTFPTSAMGSFAEGWRSLLPVSHYIELQIGQANYGQPLAHALSQLAPLLLFLPLLGVVARRYRSESLAPSPTGKGAGSC